MAGVQWLQFLFADTGSANTGANYGPYNVNPIGKLFEVRVRGALIFSNTTVGNVTQFTDYICWGIQHVHHGNAPAAINSASNNSDVLISEVHTPDEIVIDYTPSTATAGAIVAGPLDLTWRGQLPLNGDSRDFYFQTAAFFSAPVSWRMFGSLNVRFA